MDVLTRFIFVQCSFTLAPRQCECSGARDWSNGCAVNRPTHEQIPRLQRRTAISTSTPWPSWGVARGDSFLNVADAIEEQLHIDGHHVWGLAIYRCTYGNEATWKLMLKRLNATIRESMRFYDGMELLDPRRFRLTLFDDASKYDGMDVGNVRQHFKDWRNRAIWEEQGPKEEIKARGGGRFPNPYCGEMDIPYLAVRYKHRVQIDSAALASIVSAEGDPDELCRGPAWVNLIDADWDPNAAAAEREQDRQTALADGEDYGLEDDEVFPPIDGCTEENVGWMKVQYQDLIPDMYTRLFGPNALDYL